MDFEPNSEPPAEPFHEIAPGQPTSFEPHWLLMVTWGFVILGILIRLTRYLVNYPIWHDEAFLAASLWDRGYVDLLRPLEYGQIAPWLFLAIERSIVSCLGYSEASLRLFPTICGIVGVVVFGRLSGRLLEGKARLVAVAVFATSVYPIRHGAEIKPYTCDLLAALILLSLAVEWIHAPRQSRWWWILAATAPVLIAVSYPAVFLAGGLSLALLPSVLRSGSPRVRMGWAVYNVMVAASFLSVYLACTQFQAAAMRQEYRNGCWAEAFPPLDRPWAIPFWFVDVTSGVMMAYPAGDRHGGSAATLICVVAGVWALIRRRRTAAVAVLLAPFGLGLAAAFLGRYPYGGAPRVMLYLAPSICLLAGAGFAAILARIHGAGRERRCFVAAVAALAMLGVGLIARDVFRPYRVETDVRTREFARWFWTEQKDAGDIACLKSDMGLSFDPGLWRVGMSAVYLFHQRMFSERHRQHLKVDLEASLYTSERPLLLVGFDHLPLDHPAFHEWLAAVLRRYEMRRTETYEIQPGKPGEEWLRDAYVVLELVPRGADKAVARRVKPGPGAGRF